MHCHKRMSQRSHRPQRSHCPCLGTLLSRGGPCPFTAATACEATRVVAQRHPPCGCVHPPADRRTWLLFGTTRGRVPPSPHAGSLWARTVMSLAQMPRNAAAGPAGHARFVLLETASFPKCQHRLTPCYSRLGLAGSPTLNAVESATSATRGRVAYPAFPEDDDAECIPKHLLVTTSSVRCVTH